MDTVDQRRFAIAKLLARRSTARIPSRSTTPTTSASHAPWKDARGSGLRVFDKIRVDDPTGRLSDDATLAAGNEHFASRKFYKADEYYSDLRKAYPTSEHQFLAHFLGLKAKLNSYAGPAYGGTVLDEAEKLIKQMRRQFPQEAEREREYLDRAAAEIRYSQGRAAVVPGASTTTTGRSIGRRSTTTPASSRNSKTRRWPPRPMSASQPSPACPRFPPQKLEWLVNLFPESDEVKSLIDASQQINDQDGRSSPQSRTARSKRSRRPTRTRVRALNGPSRSSGDSRMQNSEFRIQNRAARATHLALSAFCILSSAFLLSGCAGYQIGQRSLYRPDIRTVYVPPVQSNSFRRYLGERLTEAVVKEIELKTPYKVVDSDAADSVLTVKLVSESKRVLTENFYDEPRDIETDFFVQLSWVDRRGDLIMNHNDLPAEPLLLNISQTANFVPEAGQSLNTAQQEAIQRLAEQVVGQMELAW